MELMDVPAVHALECICFPDPWSEQSFLEEARHSGDGGYSRILLEGSELLAYSIAWFVLDEVHLANIAVAPENRRAGAARLLLDDLFREATLRGSRMAVLEVRVSNEPAIRLYRKYGFKEVAIRKNYYARQQEDALVMIRSMGCREEDSDGLAL